MTGKLKLALNCCTWAFMIAMTMVLFGVIAFYVAYDYFMLT